MVEGVIDALRRREDASGSIQFDPAPSFSVGDWVRVTSGAFADTLGLFEGGDDRAGVAVYSISSGERSASCLTWKW